MIMANSTPVLEVIKFSVWFFILILIAILSDVVLHQFGLVWIGRYFGLAGSLIIVLSFMYSMRKRGLIKQGNIRKLLYYHEIACWTGSLFVLIHAGVHFSAIIPWIALAMVLLNLASGFVGRYLLKESGQMLSVLEAEYKANGLSVEEIKDKLFWESLTFSLMKKWKKFHLPIAFMLLITALIHIVSILFFINEY
jgi:hypothetical protein